MIRVEDVLAAYKKIGLKPIQGRFATFLRDGCCPMSALALVDGAVSLSSDTYVDEVIRWGFNKYGSYFAGFLRGVDGLEIGPIGSDAEEGLRDGDAVRRTLFPESVSGWSA